MSDVVVPTVALPALLDAVRDGLVAFAHLYTNDVALGPATVKGDFVEVLWDGYQEQEISRLTPAYLRGGRAVSMIDPAIFTFAGGPVPLPVRGYFATEGRDGRLLWAWRLPAGPLQLDADHPYLVIYARFTLPGGPA